MFTHIASIVPRAIRKYNLTRQARAALVCERYRKEAAEIFPPEILTHAWPKKLHNKILTVAVDHPIFAEQIIQQKHKLLERINRSLGKTPIIDIRTKVEEKF